MSWWIRTQVDGRAQTAAHSLATYEDAVAKRTELGLGDEAEIVWQPPIVDKYQPLLNYCDPTATPEENREREAAYRRLEAEDKAKFRYAWGHTFEVQRYLEWHQEFNKELAHIIERCLTAPVSYIARLGEPGGVQLLFELCQGIERASGRVSCHVYRVTKRDKAVWLYTKEIQKVRETFPELIEPGAWSEEPNQALIAWFAVEDEKEAARKVKEEAEEAERQAAIAARKAAREAKVQGS